MLFSLFHWALTNGKQQRDKIGVAFLLALCCEWLPEKGQRPSDISTAIASLLDGRDRPKK